MQTSVVETLKAAGLYKETGRIEEQMLVTVLPNGERREHKMAEIDYADIKIFADELDIALNLQNPLIQSLYAKNAEGLVNLIRTVNAESASGFKGSVGSGRQLDALLFRAEQFQDPDNATTAARVSWIRTIAAAAGQTQFIVNPGAEAVGSKVALAMANEQGVAILGFANPAAALCVDAVAITYLAQAYNIQNLDFELANPFVGDVIVELKQPLLIFPKESALVTVHYYRAGIDELRPIGLWIKMSSILRTLASS
ncbi:hypothetical protein ES705_48296 [subsurface metagenome]